MIPFFDYRRQWHARRAQFLDTIQRVLDSGQLILGPEVRAFELELSAMQGGGYGIGVNSGTDALVLALRAFDIQAGDEVITVPNTAVPTVAAIRMVGAQPVFVDIEADTLLMDVDGLEAICGPKTKAIIPVHLHGLPVAMEPLLAWARSRGLAVIEDCAQSLGATYQGRAAGSLGDIGCYSFYPTKNLGAFGDGGLCLTADPQRAERLRKMRMYGFDENAQAVCDGINSRLDEIQAAILRLKLSFFDEDMQKRQNLAQRYRERLDPKKFKLPASPSDRTHAFHIFAIRTAFRNRYQQILLERGIRSGIHYPCPIHLMPAYQDLAYRPGDLPVAEQAAAELLSLPLFPELQFEEQDRVIATLNEVSL